MITNLIKQFSRSVLFYVREYSVLFETYVKSPAQRYFRRKGLLR
jgi:hypothetical protein